MKKVEGEYVKKVLSSRKCKLRQKHHSKLDLQKDTEVYNFTEVNGCCECLSALKIRLQWST